MRLASSARTTEVTERPPERRRRRMVELVNASVDRSSSVNWYRRTRASTARAVGLPSISATTSSDNKRVSPAGGAPLRPVPAVTVCVVIFDGGEEPLETTRLALFPEVLPLLPDELVDLSV